MYGIFCLALHCLSWAASDFPALLLGGIEIGVVVWRVLRLEET